MIAVRAHYGSVIVGGGPAGLAPLVSASRDGRLTELLDGGVAVVERGPVLGAGRLGDYAISSDSTAETFLTAVTGHTDPRLGALLDSPLCRDLQRLGRNAVPLVMAGALMRDIGAVLTAAIGKSGGAVLTGHEALGATQAADGSWIVRLRRTDGAEVEISADALVLATGGDQTSERLRTEFVAGRPLLPTYETTLVASDDALRRAGLARIRQRLDAIGAPKVAIVGGSTSAIATAGLLLRECPGALMSPGSITILHRRPLRVFYPSANAAHAEGYTEFGPLDLCPLSGFVFRLAGFRLESRDLLMSIRQIGGRPPEHRVVLHTIADAAPGATHDVLERADLIIAALGYRPRALPLFKADGREQLLLGRVSPAPLVDEACHIRDDQGRPIRNLFGIGLAAGFVPRGTLGGEPSFVGQANGLWLWQTAVGSLIVDGLLAAEADLSREPTGFGVAAAEQASPVPM